MSLRRSLALPSILAATAFAAGCGQPLDSEVALEDDGIIADNIPDTSFEPATQSATERRVLTLINQARATARVCGSTSYAKAPALAAENRLDLAAQGHSRDMATNNYFSHTGRDGSMPWDRVTRQGYAWSSVGENIAAGYSTPEAVVQGWLSSPGHCANIMNPRYTQTGIGLATGGSYRYYWTQVFARPR